MEDQEKIERRTYVGATSTMGFDGWASFGIGQQYQLRYIREFDEVRIVLDHASTPDRVLTITVEQFGK